MLSGNGLGFKRQSWALGAGHTDGMGKTVFGATSPHLEGPGSLAEQSAGEQ